VFDIILIHLEFFVAFFINSEWISFLTVRNLENFMSLSKSDTCFPH
jgi:hypothetical protein